LIPVQLTAAASPIGALELDQDYRTVDVGLGDARTRLGLILAIAFLVLYLSLFPILSRLTRQLKSHNEALHQQAGERERLLEAERSARAEAESIQRLLTEQNERLRELDRMKDEFVSLVSHELRTPLTSIRGYLELLLDDERELTPEQQRFLGIIDRNSRRLLDLVGDLLFLAQVDAGKLAIETEEVDLEHLVRDCIETSTPLAESREITLVAATTALPTLVGDRARLSQVLDNLVSNALKFTPAGGRVTVVLQAEGDHAVLEVLDNGIGVPAAEQPELFKRFFRSSRASEDAVPGTGLGLAITKTIVERHGGRIAIQSEENKGTAVRVELPLVAPQEAQLPSRTLAA
jgi:signal transduction histidine kinase